MWRMEYTKWSFQSVLENCKMLHMPFFAIKDINKVQIEVIKLKLFDL